MDNHYKQNKARKTYTIRKRDFVTRKVVIKDMLVITKTFQ